MRQLSGRKLRWLSLIKRFPSVVYSSILEFNDVFLDQNDRMEDIKTSPTATKIIDYSRVN